MNGYAILIRFKDQEEVWQPYDRSIFQLQAYKHFCTLRPELLESNIAAKKLFQTLRIQALAPVISFNLTYSHRDMLGMKP
jgi:hypothetical protein